MGPVNWLAVVLAMVAAMVVQAVWYGPVLGGRVWPKWGRVAWACASRPRARWLTAALLLVSATMMGHMFARVGAATLASSPGSIS
jgi:hypothetical protein